MKKGKSTKRRKINSKKMRKLKEKVLEDFRVLMNNLIPMNPDQAEWICSEIERLSKNHPYLRAKLNYIEFQV